MELSDLKPKSASFFIRVGGKKKKITLRPFTLRDQAWIQENFKDEELLEKILMHNITAIGRVIWQMMDPKSKKAIMSIKATFEDIDPITGKEVVVDPVGYERLISFLDDKSLQDGLEAFAKTRGVNAAFVEKQLNSLKKKKTAPAQ